MKKLIQTTCVILVSVSGLWANEFKVAGGSGEVGKSAGDYSAAASGKTYPLGWWARTGSDRLNIEFNEQNVFRLLPKSEVQVTGEGAANTKFRRILNLKSGGVDLDLPTIKTTGSKVEVQTPTAICGAVGTAFSVDADSGKFNVREGKISAQAKGDDSFAAQSVNGSFTLNPGKENGFSNANNVSGSFTLNGKSYSGSGVNLQVAKGKGDSMAAVRVSGGSVGGAGSGSYIMDGGKLVPVDPSQATLHSSYLNAAQREGQLNVQIKSGAGGSQAQLDQAAAAATELRKRLFQRKVVRDTVKDTVRQINPAARPVRIHP
jgi:hypothetical protein